MTDEMTEISISNKYIVRLEQFATGFGKTANDAIGKVLDIAEASMVDGPVASLGPAENEVIRQYEADSPPNLKHTTIDSALVDGSPMARGQNYWNNIMHETIRKAALAGKSAEEIFEHSSAHVVLEERSDNGFKYIPEAKVSVQGQGSNNAWRQIVRMAKLGRFAVAVEFRWQENDKAERPGAGGSICI